jgi:D-glycero-D-manno-heptose 1,7-bisphosphate phosphatase
MSWVLLDRDGVINEDSDAYIKSPAEWIPIPGSLEAIAALNGGGFRVAVLTNQSGVGRGLLDLPALYAIHGKMLSMVEAAGGRIEHIFFCPHGPEDGCRCRKPNVGLFEQFAEQFGADLRDVPAIGDSLRDIQAAQAVGASPILVETGKGARTLQRNPHLDLQTFANLHEATQFLLYTHA